MKTSFLTKGLVDDKTKEQKIFGIQPKNQFALRLYLALLVLGMLMLVLGILSTIILMYTNPPKLLLIIMYYIRITTLILGIFCIPFSYVIKSIFLRKAPFDDWIYEISATSLGTKVIFYTSKSLFIQFDRNNKEVDKKDFILKMAERSDNYSYFLVRTYIDEGFLEVTCTKKQPLPTYVEKKVEDDNYITAVPLGVALNNNTKKVEPVTWRINTEEKVKGILDTLPAVSIAIVGGTGSGKSVTLNNILAHVCKFSDDVQMIGIDLKQVEFTRFLGVRGVKAVAWDIVTATEMLVAFRRIMKKKYSMLQEYKENNQYKIKNEKVNYYELADGSVFQFDEIFQVTQDLDKTNRDYSKLTQREGFENGRINTIYTIEELYEGIKKGKISNPQIPERKGMNCWLDDTSIRKIEQRVFRPKLTIMMCDEFFMRFTIYKFFIN